jgi:hypothetical protein
MAPVNIPGKDAPQQHSYGFLHEDVFKLLQKMARPCACFSEDASCGLSHFLVLFDHQSRPSEVMNPYAVADPRFGADKAPVPASDQTVLTFD